MNLNSSQLMTRTPINYIIRSVKSSFSRPPLTHILPAVARPGASRSLGEATLPTCPADLAQDVIRLTLLALSGVGTGSAVRSLFRHLSISAAHSFGSVRFRSLFARWDQPRLPVTLSSAQHRVPFSKRRLSQYFEKHELALLMRSPR